MNLAFYTLGCKVNQYETSAIIKLASAKGHKILPFPKGDEKNLDIDAFIINTCTVTSMSDRKSRQIIRKARKSSEKAIICVMGCYSQINKDEATNMPEIDIVIGTLNRQKIINLLENYNGNKISEIENPLNCRVFEDISSEDFGNRTRATLKIEDGCQNFCSYCIIPFARGPVRSKEPLSIIKEVKDIVKKGYKEIVLTGIHLDSYGKDFKNDVNLATIINLVSHEDIERIRLGSLEPIIITRDFLDSIKDADKLCHHFHLSLQSGSDGILKRMNRNYDTKTFKEAALLLHEYFDDVMITTDIIAGFPGETMNELDETIKFINEIKFLRCHVFPYSIRKGTKAADMPMQIDENEKRTRAKKIIGTTNLIQNEVFKNEIGKVYEVLVEQKVSGFFMGHSKNYLPIKFKDITGKLEYNQNVLVKLINFENEFLIGEMITKEDQNGREK